jgi:hypothetical protein
MGNRQLLEGESDARDNTGVTRFETEKPPRAFRR